MSFTRIKPIVQTRKKSPNKERLFVGGGEEEIEIEARPASAFDVFHELGDELVSEVAPEVAGVELHVSLQNYVEEHFFSQNATPRDRLKNWRERERW